MPAPARGCASTRPPSGGGWRGSSACSACGCSRPSTACASRRGNAKWCWRMSQAMAAHVAEIDRIGESLPGPVGRLRIASTNAVAEEVLSPRAGRFLRAESGADAAIPHLQRERQILALGGRPRHPPAQARQGRFRDFETGGRPAVFHRAGRRLRGRAGGLRLSGRTRPIPETQFLKSRGAAGAGALRHRQYPRHPDADPRPSGRRRAARI